MNVKQHAMDMVRFAHGTIENALQGFPPDKGTFQPSPTDNHLLWTLGHLAGNYVWFASLLDSKAKLSAPQDFQALYAMGSKPKADAGAYPSLGELKSMFHENFEAYVRVIERIPEAELARAVGAETHGFVTTKLDSIYKCAWHDGWHGGQLAGVRKALDAKGAA